MATGIKTKVLGKARLIRGFRELPRERQALVSTAIFHSGLDVVSAARDSLKGARSGKPYKRYDPTRTGIASEVGEAPAWDEGTLSGSIFIEPNGPAQRVSVGSRLPYARWLELGYKKVNGESEGARPWLRPAFQKMLPRIKRRMKDAAKGKR